MIDPIHSLSFSIQANRGVYAVLVGSGISRAAEIPTGWEITLDLVRKLATLRGETAEPDPEAWYREKFGTEPDYSYLLENLARTPAERQQLLRSYWEPDEQEREEGDKQPTTAHHAIAALVAQGFIMVPWPVTPRRKFVPSVWTLKFTWVWTTPSTYNVTVCGPSPNSL